MRRRRQPPAPPHLPEGKMYFPGNVAPGFDPVVPRELVENFCKGHMMTIAKHEDWRTDPTYNLARRSRR